MNVGDKLLYKNDIKKNEYYIITNIDNDSVYVSYVWYSLNPESFWYIWNYFYKLKELRKLKLKQLNDESR